MTASDDARDAMAGAEAAGWHPKDWLDARMPDGRTIAQHLDDGAALEAAVRRLHAAENSIEVIAAGEAIRLLLGGDRG